MATYSTSAGIGWHQPRKGIAAYPIPDGESGQPVKRGSDLAAIADIGQSALTQDTTYALTSDYRAHAGG